MLERLRSQIGTAGLIVAIVALVAALGGGAYAATSGGKATASAKGKQGPRGKTGKTGPAGPQGAQGPAGPAGPKGDAGAPGANGTNGTDGTDGEDGQDGANGSPWVVGQAPGGVLMKGTWSLPPYTATAAEEELFVPFSTGVPVASGAATGGVSALIGPEPATGCSGTAEEPKSENAGILCIYPAELANVEPEIFLGASKLKMSGGGLVVRLKTVGAGVAKGYGSWALRTP